MTAPACTTRRADAEQRDALGSLSYRLLDAALAARVHLSLGQPSAVRGQLLRAFDALAALDAALPPDLPAAPAAGPRHLEESRP